MNPKRKQSGFILIVAVSMIPLVAIGIWVLTQHSRSLIREIQTQKWRADGHNIICSARAWADLHRDEILTAPPQQTWAPDLEPLQIPRAACQISVLSRTPDGCTLEIVAVTRTGEKSWTEKRTMTLSR